MSSSGSGVWVFKNGVLRLGENPGSDQASTVRRKALLHTASNEVVSSYSALESKLEALGWERYYEDPALLQFHKRGSLDLISLPTDFSNFSAVHMYDVVVKNRDSFRVVVSSMPCPFMPFMAISDSTVLVWHVCNSACREAGSR